jgi:hypothetical protein
MQLPIVEEPEVETNALIALTTSWCEESEELHVTSYTRNETFSATHHFLVFAVSEEVIKSYLLYP